MNQRVVYCTSPPPLTPPTTPSIVIAPFSGRATNPLDYMDDNDLKALERRVDELIRVVERLRDENHSLRESHATLVAERAALIEKSELARSRVEAMVTRLKAMEQQ